MSEQLYIPDEQGMEWSGLIAGRSFRASGSFSANAGHLTVYADPAASGSSQLLCALTWHGPPIERMSELSQVLSMLSAEIAEQMQVTSGG